MQYWSTQRHWRLRFSVTAIASSIVLGRTEGSPPGPKSGGVSRVSEGAPSDVAQGRIFAKLRRVWNDSPRCGLAVDYPQRLHSCGSSLRAARAVVALAKVQPASNEIERNLRRGNPESQRRSVRPGPPTELYPIFHAFVCVRILIPDTKAKVWPAEASHAEGQAVKVPRQGRPSIVIS